MKELRCAVNLDFGSFKQERVTGRMHASSSCSGGSEYRESGRNNVREEMVENRDNRHARDLRGTDLVLQSHHGRFQ